jgi:hypothetical protein
MTVKKKQLLISIVTCVVLAFSCSQPSSGPQPAPSAPSVAAQPVRPPRALRSRLQSTQSAPTVADPRTPAQLAAAACSGGKCKGTVAGKTMLAASGSTPIIPPSWTVPNWYIDPANSATCASDTNSGTAATCTGGCTGSTCPSGIGPLIHWGELAVHRWGTWAPQIFQNTVITQLSDQTAFTDPVLLQAYTFESATNSITVQGTPTQLDTSTFSSVVAASRSAGTTWHATTGKAGAASNYWTAYVGMLLQDTTTGAWGWVNEDLGSKVAEVTWPMLTTSNNIPPQSTMATSDTYVVWQPTKIYAPNESHSNGEGDHPFNFTELWFQAPAEFQPCEFERGFPVFNRCNFQCFVSTNMAATQEVIFANSWLSSGASFNVAYVFGGDVGGGASDNQVNISGNEVILDGGTYIETLAALTGSIYWADAFIRNTFTLGDESADNFGASAGASLIVVPPVFYSTSSIWGPAGFDIRRGNQLVYTSTATLSLLLTGTMKVNGSTTGNSVSAAGAIATGITINRANLDATAGVAGFGGAVWDPGGAKLSKF